MSEQPPASLLRQENRRWQAPRTPATRQASRQRCLRFMRTHAQALALSTPVSRVPAQDVRLTQQALDDLREREPMRSRRTSGARIAVIAAYLILVAAGGQEHAARVTRYSARFVFGEGAWKSGNAHTHEGARVCRDGALTALDVMRKHGRRCRVLVEDEIGTLALEPCNIFRARGRRAGRNATVIEVGSRSNCPA